MSNWQRIDTKIAYQNPNLTVHEDNVITPDGKSEVYAWVETPPSVFVVAIEGNGKVVLVKQLRYTTGQPSWSLPGGSSDGKDALDAAKLGLETEAGVHADKWVSLSGDYYVWNGMATQRNSVHIARDLHKAKSSKPEGADVVLATESFEWSELKEMIKSGELSDGESITALTLAGLHLGHLK
jgi:8-oxo-dGTP pyrophosphatase MutT (NUDIX family)